jgi:hypothetical protein
MTTQRLFPAGLLIVAAVALADMTLDVHWVGRPLFAVVYLLLVPGYAVAGHLRLDPFVAVVTVAIALSITIGTLTAQLLLWVNVWHPEAAQIVIGLPAMALLVMQVVALGPEPGVRLGRRTVES